MTVEEAQEFYGSKAVQALEKISEDFHDACDVWPTGYQVAMASVGDHQMPTAVFIDVEEP